MDYFTEDYFRLHRRCMQILLTWPLTKSDKVFYLKVFCYVIFDSVCLFGLWGSFNQLISYVDVTVFAPTAITFLSFVLALIRNNMLLLKRKSLKNIILTLSDLYNNTPLEMTKELKASSEQSKKKYQVFARTFMYTLTSLTGFYHITPIVVYFLTGKQVLAYPNKYPFSIEPLGIFVMLSILQLIFTVTTAMTEFEDTMILGINSFICTRIDALVEFLNVSVKEAAVSKHLFGECVRYQIKIYK